MAKKQETKNSFFAIYNSARIVFEIYKGHSSGISNTIHFMRQFGVIKMIKLWYWLVKTLMKFDE
jgi:hypothetical protein